MGIKLTEDVLVEDVSIIRASAGREARMSFLQADTDFTSLEVDERYAFDHTDLSAYSDKLVAICEAVASDPATPSDKRKPMTSFISAVKTELRKACGENADLLGSYAKVNGSATWTFKRTK